MDATPSGTDRYDLTITVRGEIDLASVDSLLQRLIDLAHPATGKIALDLAQVDFIDCAGLHMLADIDRHVQARGGSLHIVAASPAVAYLFSVTCTIAAVPDFHLPEIGPPASIASEQPPATRLNERSRPLAQGATPEDTKSAPRLVR